MRIDAVLVEFDGVVADTFGARRIAVDRALAEHGLTLSDDEYWELCAGWPTSEAVRSINRKRRLDLDETAIDLLALHVDRAYSAHIGKGVVLVDGARSSLERFAGRARVAAVSRLRRSDVQDLISLARLDHVFSFVVGEEDAYPPKPDPAPYRAALRRLARFRGEQHGTIVALENGVAGIRAARAAGLPCVAVGMQPAHVALEANAFVSSITGMDIAMIDELLTPHVDPP
ncbi:MAG: HAD family hydrolase [Gemmatimonadaceae bacterium]|nr:HAD family hydrolase [Gemmatimonadaceae bacterium]